MLAWSCAPLPKEENGMAVDGSSSPPVLAKRDHEGDVEMSHFSPENASRTISLSSSDTWTDLWGEQKRTRYL